MEDDNRLFSIDRAKGGRASCKGCKEKCLNGELRLAKLTPSPYGEDKKMKNWYHVDCLMTAFIKQRPTTKRIDSSDDIENWSNMSSEDQELVLDKLKDMEMLLVEKYGSKAIVKPKETSKKNSNDDVPSSSKERQLSSESASEDCLFKDFRKVCIDITNPDAYTAKTAVVKKLFTEGVNGKGFNGDIKMWCRLLLPGAIKRIYNLKSKQLVKLFSRIFNADQDDMLTDLEDGDVAVTIYNFFEKSTHCAPSKKSLLTLSEVDSFLDKLSTFTKEDEQVHHFRSIVKNCTANDLKYIIRLIKGDLRINAGPKHILEGVHSDAYKLFQSSKDINSVIDRVMTPAGGNKNSVSVKSPVKASLVLMTPFYPMLAEACKSVEMAIKKCPNGMFSEIKYDGERVQIHKKGSEFKYFSRSLKPVTEYKIARLKEFIPKAFPNADELILDSEILMVDTTTGKPLPFGTLGVHKRAEFSDAEVCLYIFDCMFYNGEYLMEKPLKERRKILEKNMISIKNHILLSEKEVITKASDLAGCIAKALKEGLEGLVLKDLESKYEPGKRHWIKVKKDYLFDGKMADSTDLVVLGAWFGTGKKGGMLSVFLMGCYDGVGKKWVTVTKVHTGHDDKQLESLQEPFRKGMNKISKDSSLPSWLLCDKKMIPDFLAKDPRNQPVWEITGAEFTKANIHTADGISVRFPRVTRIRDDKTWQSATSLKELKILYNNSKDHVDVSLLNKIAAASDDEDVQKKQDTKKEIKKEFVTTLKIDKEVDKSDLSTQGSSTKPNNLKRKATVLDSLRESNQLTMVPRYSNATLPNKKRCSVVLKNSDKSSVEEKINKDKEDDVEKVIANLMMDSTTSFINTSKLEADTSYPHLPSMKTERPNPTSNHFKDSVLSFYCRESLLTDIAVKDYMNQWEDASGKLDLSDQRTSATHVVHFTNELSVGDLKNSGYKFQNSARHVTLQWLKDSLIDKKLADVRFSSVLLKPTC